MHSPATNLKFAQDIGKPKIGNLHSLGLVLVKHLQEILENMKYLQIIFIPLQDIGQSKIGHIHLQKILENITISNLHFFQNIFLYSFIFFFGPIFQRVICFGVVTGLE